MIHLRIVAPAEIARHALELLCASPAVLNVVHLHDAARKPTGDVILCDVLKEEASVILSDLKELDIPRVGSIAVEHVDITLSDAAVEAERAAPGLPSDAVVWEEVQQRTSEDTELSINFVAFMVLAMQLAAVGILLDQPILIVGAMVVGPEFGPLAGLSVALVRRQPDLARRSISALAVGFPVGGGADDRRGGDLPLDGHCRRGLRAREQRPHRVHLESGLLLASSWPSLPARPASSR